MQAASQQSSADNEDSEGGGIDPFCLPFQGLFARKRARSKGRIRTSAIPIVPARVDAGGGI